MNKMSTIIRYLALIMMPFIASCGSFSSVDTRSSETSSLDASSSVASPSDASLSDLTLEKAELDQVFQVTQQSYTASIGYLATTLTLRVVASNRAASITVNGDWVASGSDSVQIPLAEGDNTVTVKVTSEDGQATQRYTLEVSRASVDAFAQQAYLKASNAEEFDQFGYSVALDGDTLVVGAYHEDSSITGGEANNDFDNAGAVYVFTRVDSTWRQQATLKASNAENGDFFGYSVAVDGDTLVVGAIGEDSSADADQNNNDAPYAGAVYVFTRVDSDWSQQAYLKASNAGKSDEFGHSVALDGDTLVVGAYYEDSSDTGGKINNDFDNAGAVYVFARAYAKWSQQAYLKASNAEEGDRFGQSVAVDGDTLVVGAVGEDSSADAEQNDDGASAAGAVYVFTRVDSTWRQQAYLKASNAESNDLFGHSVALDGDTLVVGAIGEDSVGGESNNDAAGAGAVYVFTRVDSDWRQQATLKASNAESNDEFGYSVALDGETLGVGAKGEGNSAGAVYVFIRVDSDWRQQANLKANNTGRFDTFGQSVALDGDTLVVGANGEASSADGIESDNSENSAGAVYVWQ
ncbi:MAG: hypothetical protein ACI910_001799 [Oleispira sp.]|jgi:hypothetical protein